MTEYLSKPPAGVQLNHNHPLAQGLVGCWLFNEGSGLIANDLSGNNNHGTLINFEPFSSTSGWTGGNQGTSLQFDASNDYIQLNNSMGITSRNEYTISFWANTEVGAVNPSVYSEAVPSTWANNLLIIYYGDTNAANIARVFYQDSAGVGGGILNGATNVVDGLWHNVMVVQYSLSNRVLYVDGRIEDTDTVARNVLSTTDTSIGATNNNGAHVQLYNGRIGNLMVWNISLNSTEIQNLYAQPFQMFKFRKT